MLVLKRKVGQLLRIGPLTLQVIDTRDRQVRLAIDAPADVLIYREELLVRRPNPPAPGILPCPSS